MLWSCNTDNTTKETASAVQRQGPKPAVQKPSWHVLYNKVAQPFASWRPLLLLPAPPTLSVGGRLCSHTRTCVRPCCCLLPVDDNGFVVVTVKGEVVRGAGGHQLSQVAQVNNGGAVHRQDLISQVRQHKQARQGTAEH